MPIHRNPDHATMGERCTAHNTSLLAKALPLMTELFPDVRELCALGPVEMRLMIRSAGCGSTAGCAVRQAPSHHPKSTT